MKMNTNKIKNQTMLLGAFGQASFTTMESRLVSAQWLSQIKGLSFRFIPKASIARRVNPIGK